jgi:hypothetical protein
MAKLFSTRELFYRYPLLGKIRHKLLSAGCNYGTSVLAYSYRWLSVRSPGAARILEAGQPVVYAVYHGNMVALMNLQPRDKVTILVSNSRDGEMIAQAAEGMGFKTARGSTGRGGVRGLLEMIDAGRAGQSLAMLVDGPKGPRHVVKPGVIKLAQVTGLPIIPLGISSRGAWWMRSWDRYTASAWGTPQLMIFGEPMIVAADASEDEQEALRAQLDDYMRRLHAKCHGVWQFSDSANIPEFIA